MASKWIKLEGDTVREFNDQYQDMLDKNEVSEAEFPPGMFVNFMLDIRKKAQKMKGGTDGRQEPSHP